MKEGTTFKFRHSGAHSDVVLIIICDHYGNKELWNLDYGTRVGERALLDSKIIGVNHELLVAAKYFLCYDEFRPHDTILNRFKEMFPDFRFKRD